MTMTQQQAWTIFHADKMGWREQADSALKNLTGPEQQAYQVHAEEFELALAKLGIEAQNEGAAIWADNPNTQFVLENTKPYDLTADQYCAIIQLFKGSKFERLHLSAMFRVQNAELLLELVKP